MKFVKVDNLVLLRLCAVLILVSMFVYLPTTLVFGQNTATYSISIDKSSGGSSNVNILESSRVEYNSSGWTNFRIATHNATYQEGGEEKNFFARNNSVIYFLIYSGISDELVSLDLIRGSTPGGRSFSLANESSISLVMYIVNDDQMFESIEVEYSIEARGGSLSDPKTITPTISLEGSSLPFSLIVFITAFATLGTMIVLVSFRRVKLKG